MIYHFHPIDRPMLWGAEQWILSAYPGRDSICVETGQNIWQMLCGQQERLVGNHLWQRYGDAFPLLIKFIDARDNLSIQVHPSDALARKYGEPFGKTEMWYAIESEPQAKLFCGLKQHITPDTYRQMVADKTILNALAEYPVHDGDSFYIPAGRIHSIGAGCRLCEIQQTSDTTYRIYDYDRVDKNGQPRELHTERAAESIDYTVHDDYRVHYNRRQNEPVTLVSCPYFTTNVLYINQPVTRNYSLLDSFVCLICLDGEGTISEQGKKAPLTAGMLVMLPAESNGKVELRGNFRALEVYIDK